MSLGGILRTSRPSLFKQNSVYDRSIKTENDDDFLYKLIFYLSTGKIMIQGKGYELFCDNIFEQCLSLVNEYLTTSENQFKEDKIIENLNKKIESNER